jgi:hypothetical protein
MPRLGQAVEPSHGELAAPWWRAADQPSRKRARPTEPQDAGTMPKGVPWPLD